MAKAKKQNEEKWSVKGSFEDVIKVSVTPGKPGPAPKLFKPKRRNEKF